MNRTITSIVGVYNADGGPIGEAKYVIGKLLGRAHCALCDITHSPVRRKPAWDAMVSRLGVGVDLVHLNEMTPDVAAAVAQHGSPIVLARLSDGTLRPLLTNDDLERLDGSVETFEAALRKASATLDLDPNPSSAATGAG